MSYLNRRDLFVGSLATVAPVTLGKPLASASEVPRQNYEYCAFIKFLRSLNSEQLAETIADIGFQGIEATVRKKWLHSSGTSQG